VALNAIVKNERGFTLIETVIGAAIAALVLWGLLVSVDRYATASAALETRLNAQTAADRFVERITAEAASSWAAFVPRTDVLGNANANGHELDFFTEDASHRIYEWAYLYDARSKSLTRYAYAPNVTPVAGDVIGDFDAFAAQTIDVPALGDPLSSAYDPLFAESSSPVVHYQFPGLPAAVGGNSLVVVHIAASGVDRTETIASGTAPTTFTIQIPYTPSPAAQATPTPVPEQEQPFAASTP
jgi:type II secretory pathway pseudopilin PulG